MNVDERIVQIVKLVIPFRFRIFRVVSIKTIVFKRALLFMQLSALSCIHCSFKINKKKL